MCNKIAIVDLNDNIIGFEDKIKVHKEGILHRAFSVFIFNERNELLLQKRAKTKYHSPSLWSNTCCSHLSVGEEMKIAVKNRLYLEMGLKCNVKFIKKFSYKISFMDEMIENEIDYLYLGWSNNNPIINLDEVSDYKWISQDELIEELKKNPDKFTYWFLKIIQLYDIFNLSINLTSK